MERSRALIFAGTTIITSACFWLAAKHRYSPALCLGKLRGELLKRETLKSKLVAHRGFHYSTDDLKRPLENTLAAYERAWSAGVVHCECDVTLTSDGVIVLSHDDDLKRLALYPGTILKKVKECPFSQLELTPLKDGSRVPRLIEVLRAAQRVGKHCRLVIEIKGSDVECAKKVAEIASTDLGNFISVVMSFSSESVQEFAKLNPKKGQILTMLLKGSDFTLEDMSHDLSNLKEKQIDGLYLMYQAKFLTESKFKDLTREVPTGVWGRRVLDPDRVSNCHALIEKGAQFVNTDFPDNFFES